jgi:hypothetical protein
MIKTLGSQQPLYGFMPKGLTKGSQHHSSVEIMASRYIESIKKIQAVGPFWIGGECVGGIVAYEIGRQLEAQGDQVGCIFLMDTIKPTGWTAFRLGITVLTLKTAKRVAGTCARLILARRLSQSLIEIHRFLNNLRLLLFPVGTKGRELRRLSYGSQFYQRILLRYRPKSFRGRIAMLVNSDWSRKHPLMNWNKELGSRFDFFEIPGLHHTRLQKSGDMVGQVIRDIISEGISFGRRGTP